ncbi:MAG TPA: J domain-containing protein [Bdellovibrionota bacterium]|nr:J domain-containing protein [Bdellovibrionota bacterium]
MNLDFLDAVKGCEKTIRLSQGLSFKVKIPAGINIGSKIRLTGKGEPGVSGGEMGDLYIEPRILPHPYFRRNGDDIEVDLPITVTETLEGGKVKVPTIDGMVEMKIPAGAQSGQKLRLKGKGVENRQTATKGDQYVILEVHLPKNLDAKTKEELLNLLKNKEPNLRKEMK